MDKIKGELLSFRVRGNDFWGVGTVRTQHDGGDVAIVGKVLGASEGDTLELEGEWTTHDKFGRQFRVKRVEVVLASDVSGVVGWLAAKLPQISRRRAEALVAKFGVDGVWDLLERADLAALCTVEGITAPRAREITDAYRTHKDDRDRLVRFKQWGLTDNQIARVLAEWEDDAEARIEANPYDLMECVPGFGWTRADQVARKMGIALDAPPRLAAGLMHAMGEAQMAGHVYVAQGKLTALVAKKVCGVDEQLVRRALDGLLERERLVRLGVNVYLPKLARAEGRLAEVFARRSTKTGRVA
jgi:exodeoxyribonuclease V alpha subunit